MKRTSQDVVGGPIVAESGSPDVAGAPTHRAVSRLASFLDVSGEVCVSDTALIEEFAEFLAGDVVAETPTCPVADPIFRERLRRHLWRMHLRTPAPGSQEPH